MFFIRPFLVLLFIFLISFATLADPVGMWYVFKTIAVGALTAICAGVVIGVIIGLQEYNKDKYLYK
ncbi:hypothetical protein [Campylobacter sp. RM16190]|uniref:hypothetical protein n=1 Tax=Campylobacter sp. RM16190 TaxID=1705727 RepID=UPI001473FF12|nr:hypothetical protein [Campylobacter sp. RM16190]